LDNQAGFLVWGIGRFALDFVDDAGFKDSNVLVFYGIILFKTEYFVADQRLNFGLI
jgi:hypothetical protein